MVDLLKLFIAPPSESLVRYGLCVWQPVAGLA